MSISQITEDLYVGGRINASDVEALKAAGITHILNVNWPDQPEPEAIKRSFVHHDMSSYGETLDDGYPKPAWWFREGIDFSETARGGKLLVHCGHGINRSPAMLYAIMKYRGYPDPEALIRARRPQTGTGTTGGWFDIYRQSADEALDDNLH